VIGSNLVAVILHGSLVAADFVAGRSDVDLLVIVRSSLTDEQRRSLADAVTELARPRRAWVDYRVVTSEQALRPSRAPTLDFYVGMHPDLPGGVEIEHTPTGEPDLLFEYAICRDVGVSLVGPAPASLIGTVPDDWLLDVGDRCLERWQEIEYDEQHAELMIFTACRLWYRAVEGGHCSKSEAARWVIARAPDLIAPQLALERRTALARPPIASADVMTLLAEVRGVLAARG
jgi:aminoglycoside adenylyltransferase-like protein